MFHRLLAEGSFQLPEADKAFVEEMLEHNEFGVAFDALIDAIREDRIALTEADLNSIEAIGREMNVDPKRWEQLRSDDALP